MAFLKSISARLKNLINKLMMFFKNVLSKTFITYSAMVIGILAIIPLIIITTQMGINFLISENYISLEGIDKKGQLGDSFGMLNSILTIFTCAAVLISLWYQRRQLINQQYQINEERILNFMKEPIRESEQIVAELIINTGSKESVTNFLQRKSNYLHDFIPYSLIDLNDFEKSYLIENRHKIYQEVFLLDEYLNSVNNLFRNFNDLSNVYKLNSENYNHIKRLITRFIPNSSIKISLMINQAFLTLKPILMKEMTSEGINELMRFQYTSIVAQTIVIEYKSVNQDFIDKQSSLEKNFQMRKAELIEEINKEKEYLKNSLTS